MKIPDTVRIQGVDFEILHKDVLIKDGNECYGLVQYGESKIWLQNSKQDHQHKCIALWHEMIHALCNRAGLAFSEEKKIDGFSSEEEVVTALSFGIYQILQDNGRSLFDIAPKKSGGGRNNPFEEQQTTHFGEK